MLNTTKYTIAIAAALLSLYAITSTQTTKQPQPAIAGGVSETIKSK
jgi:hypothetical protein